ncbi:MAG: hypothetical protein K2Q45_05310 [Nitrosomonas sp.]|nr:hypothetical protein [Nitrosomonas sp.]
MASVSRRQYKVKRQFAFVERNEKRIKKLAKVQQALSSISTATHADRVQFLSKRKTIPPQDDDLVKCPNCDFEMTDTEVQAGFLVDNYKFTTKCVKCNHRFIAASVFQIDERKDYVTWLCRDQTKQAFSDWFETTETKPDTVLYELAKHPVVFWNIMRYAVEDELDFITWIQNNFPFVDIADDEKEES